MSLYVWPLQAEERESLSLRPPCETNGSYTVIGSNGVPAYLRADLPYGGAVCRDGKTQGPVLMGLDIDLVYC